VSEDVGARVGFTGDADGKPDGTPVGEDDGDTLVGAFDDEVGDDVGDFDVGCRVGVVVYIYSTDGLVSS